MGKTNWKGFGQKKLTLDDVAKALGVSKTTVSRAISGKGRISDATRNRVLEYIEKNNYKPNLIAKSLAESKTFNIAVVMPGDYVLNDLPFFQSCLIGISEFAATCNYDVLICVCYENDLIQLERIVDNNKVDGVILTRTFVEDKFENYLFSKGIPFATIGTSMNPDVVQVDNDHKEACNELVSYLLMKGCKRIGLIGGDESHVVTLNRYKGYEKAHMQLGIPIDKDIIYMNAQKIVVTEKSAMNLLEKKVDVIVCMDDFICAHVLSVFRKEKIKVPEDIRIASFYNSVILENNSPSITTIQFDNKQLGRETCRALIDLISGKNVNKRLLLPYEVILKESTK